jgi:hypothetical protein
MKHLLEILAMPLAVAAVIATGSLPAAAQDNGADIYSWPDNGTAPYGGGYQYYAPRPYDYGPDPGITGNCYVDSLNGRVCID